MNSSCHNGFRRHRREPQIAPSKLARNRSQDVEFRAGAIRYCPLPAGRGKPLLRAGIGVVLPGHEFVQNGREFMKTVQVSGGQLLQLTVTGPGQADTNHATIVLIGCALYQPGGLGAINELDHAVRP